MSSQLLGVLHQHVSSIWPFADNTLMQAREALLTVPMTTLIEKAVVSFAPCHMSSL